MENNESSEKIRLSFTGDIMCEMSQNEACKTAEGYDYEEIFAEVKPLLSSVDYCIGNLETPFAGEDADFTNHIYSFNTPDDFAKSLKSAGFDMLTTANNHCLDREIQGLFRTLDVLDQSGLEYTGTSRSIEEREKPFVRNINDFKIGFVNYTYGTNAFANNCFLKDDERFAINLFQPQETLPGSIHLLESPERIASEVEALYREPNPVYENEVSDYLKQLETDIQNCREAGAEFVFVLMHSGGQYNPVPEAYTEYLVERIEQAGADMIVGHHTHVVHKFEHKNAKFPVAYSLGNFAFSPGKAPAAVKNPITETALIFNVELKREKQNIEISSLSFSVTRCINQDNGKSVIVPMFDLIETTEDQELKKQLIKDNSIVVNTFLNSPLDTPVKAKKEYLIDVG